MCFCVLCLLQTLIHSFTLTIREFSQLIHLFLGQTCEVSAPSEKQNKTKSVCLSFIVIIIIYLFTLLAQWSLLSVVQSIQQPDKDGLRRLKSGRRHFTWGCADTLLIKASPHISAPKAREAQWIITCWVGACINVGLKVRGGIIFQGVDREGKFCCKRVQKLLFLERKKHLPCESGDKKIKEKRSWNKSTD